jgi:hypothetical protein
VSARGVLHSLPNRWERREIKRRVGMGLTVPKSRSADPPAPKAICEVVYPLDERFRNGFGVRGGHVVLVGHQR